MLVNSGRTTCVRDCSCRPVFLLSLQCSRSSAFFYKMQEKPTVAHAESGCANAIQARTMIAQTRRGKLPISRHSDEQKSKCMRKCFYPMWKVMMPSSSSSVGLSESISGPSFADFSSILLVRLSRNMGSWSVRPHAAFL